MNSNRKVLLFFFSIRERTNLVFVFFIFLVFLFWVITPILSVQSAASGRRRIERKSYPSISHNDVIITFQVFNTAPMTLFPDWTTIARKSNPESHARTDDPQGEKAIGDEEKQKRSIGRNRREEKEEGRRREEKMRSEETRREERRTEAEEEQREAEEKRYD